MKTSLLFFDLYLTLLWFHSGNDKAEDESGAFDEFPNKKCFIFNFIAIKDKAQIQTFHT